ncbi:DNA-protecting protein DprA, partial [bacterium]|nr:DNA-protecting protein DprA [bacterium]
LNGIVADRVSQLHDAPQTLFYLGADPNELLQGPSVAIVGSRKMTPYGHAVTTKLATDLTRAGVTVVSGLALGVDAAAQRAVVAAGGKTIAVLAGGLDAIHPASHAGLARQIVDLGGVLASEYTVGVPAHKSQFIARNRLVAALADAVIITEAAIKSGSLHTADFALDLGKPICAVPGPITSNTSQGTNQLLKNGAHVIACAQDVLDILGIGPLTSKQQTIFGLNPQQMKILSLMQTGVNKSEELYAKAGMNESDFAQALTMLEIHGHIRSLGSSNWQLL